MDIHGKKQRGRKIKMIWVTSDWHFCHDKPFLYEPRGFTSQYDMNEAIIKNYNSVVNSEDEIYCLGDCILSDNELGLQCIKSLKGKIHIIRGNHCTDNRIQLYKTCYNVVEVCDAKYLKYNKYNFFLSHFPCITSNYDDDKSLHKKLINLCGHTHTQDKFIDSDKGLIYHTEVDAHNCYPVSIEQIIKDIKEKELKEIKF